ncbi:unnamed protein product, partial [Citrullus colocynthis]
ASLLHLPSLHKLPLLLSFSGGASMPTIIRSGQRCRRPQRRLTVAAPNKKNKDERWSA